MLLDVLYVLLRWLHFSALMLLAGVTCFTVVLAPRRYQPHLSERCHVYWQWGSLLVLISALLMLMVQTGLMADGWPSVREPAIWLAVLNTGFGQAWQWQISLAGIGCIALRLSGRSRQRSLLLLAVAQLVGLAFVGHAAMHDGAFGVAQRVNHIVHLLSASYWAGGLVALFWVMSDVKAIETRSDAIRSMIRFSRYGHLAVALVILSGIANTLFIRGWPWHSFAAYSELLLIKVVLVGVMVIMALINRYWMVPHFRDAASSAQRTFIWLTCAEAGLALLVSGLVSWFATLQPA